MKGFIIGLIGDILLFSGFLIGCFNAPAETIAESDGHFQSVNDILLVDVTEWDSIDSVVMDTTNLSPTIEIPEIVDTPEETVYYEDTYTPEYIPEESPYEEPTPAYMPESYGLTPESGVNYFGDRTETYYSSNVLYHYKTPEWTADENGVYRDQEGFVVVAASDIPYGSEIDTSFGPGKVYDTGSDPGITDIYVNW